VGIDNKADFCEQLTSWLEDSDWHFTTLLAISIESISPLPDDVDELINDILYAFPVKPGHKELCTYLNNSQRISDWFNKGYSRPTIRYNRHFPTKKLHSKTRLSTDITGFNELAECLGVTSTQLNWLADVWRSDFDAAAKYNHYHYNLIAKRRGGNRLIESPKKLLKRIQRQVNDEILSQVPTHEAAHGFCKNRNCLSHVKNHVGKKYLFLFDLSHCFQSIEWSSVYSVFLGLGYEKTVARCLTSLCTNQFNGEDRLLAKLDSEQKARIGVRHLPQGAPTSPALSNIILYRLDNRLWGLAKSLQLKYSRYADDIAFSGNKIRDWDFLETVTGAICLEEGFQLNHRKSRIIKPQQRQKLTGIVVNKKPNIDRREYDLLKATLTNCVRYGLDSQNRDNHKDFRAHLKGRIDYVTSLNRSKGEKLCSLFNQIAGF